MIRETGIYKMKLKYYLRGLGIGIAVTALLMGYSNKNRAAEPKAEVATEETAGDLLADRNGEATTEEVIEQSTVENVTVETDSAETSEEETSQEETELESSTQEAETITETESVTETETESVQAEETTDKKEQTQSGTEADAGNAPQTTIEINIVRGDDSGTVARKLQNAGMVESATEYDAYLMQHGYDKKIRVGKVEIPVDATWQEIAEYISGKR